jgi:fructose-1,6-bisphosphatase/inositol monophosphatase family enzyme
MSMTATSRHYRSCVARFDADSDDSDILVFLHDVADAAADALDGIGDWGLSGRRDGQYAADLVVDDAVVAMLTDSGMRVLSEESGFAAPGRPGELVVVVDPVDGSTNAAHGIPWFATALCVFDADGPRVSLVAEQSGSEARFSAVRGAGALVDGVRLERPEPRDLAASVVGLNGIYPSPPWWQTRVLGAASLDLCLVATGALDGYVDLHGLGVWDYSASLLVCSEAGCLIGEADGKDLHPFAEGERRRPLAASSPELFGLLSGLR